MTAVTTTYSVNGAAGSPVNLGQLRELVAATSHLDAEARVEVVKGQSLFGETKTAAKVSVAGELVLEPEPIKVGDTVRMVRDSSGGQHTVCLEANSGGVVSQVLDGVIYAPGHYGPTEDWEVVKRA